MATTLGERIQAARERKGLAADAFAEQVGINRTTLWRIETGKLNPNVQTVKAIASALRCTTDSLLRGV